MGVNVSANVLTWAEDSGFELTISIGLRLLRAPATAETAYPRSEIDRRLQLLSRDVVPAVEPTTWSSYESPPRNPCSLFQLPQTGGPRRAHNTRRTTHALSRPGILAQEQVSPIHAGIREPRFNATLGVQLLGHLNFAAVDQLPYL
jgi:hypothetical protein